MKITDIIRGILDLTDAALSAQQPEEPVITVVAEPDSVEEPTGQPDLLAVIQQLAGLEPDVEPVGYANEPDVIVAPLEASFPAGDDMHHSKNPADIRTNAPSMYPGYQAEKP